MWFPVTLAMPNAILETAVLSWPCHPLSAPPSFQSRARRPWMPGLAQGVLALCCYILSVFVSMSPSSSSFRMLSLFHRCGCSLIVVEANMGLEGGGAFGTALALRRLIVA